MWKKWGTGNKRGKWYYSNLRLAIQTNGIWAQIINNRRAELPMWLAGGDTHSKHILYAGKHITAYKLMRLERDRWHRKVKQVVKIFACNQETNESIVSSSLSTLLIHTPKTNGEWREMIYWSVTWYRWEAASDEKRNVRFTVRKTKVS